MQLPVKNNAALTSPYVCDDHTCQVSRIDQDPPGISPSLPLAPEPPENLPGFKENTAIPNFEPTAL